jgi:hypothetical protein
MITYFFHFYFDFHSKKLTGISLFCVDPEPDPDRD